MIKIGIERFMDENYIVSSEVEMYWALGKFIKLKFIKNSKFSMKPFNYCKTHSSLDFEYGL